MDQGGCEVFKTFFAKKIKTHSICYMHLHSAVNYKMFGSNTNIMSQLNDAHNHSKTRRKLENR